MYLTENYKNLPKELREIYEELRNHKSHPIKIIDEDRNLTKDIENAIYHLKNDKLSLQF